MGSWKAKNTKKETNTEQQKRATFRLFQGFWDNKPIRKIAEPDAAAFHDALIVLDPLWARKPGAAELSWTALIRTYGNRPRGLSDATINRHLAALKSLWDWARRRGFCSGDNPFDGFHRKLKAGDNVSPYLAWTEDDLNVLLNPPPRRRDLLEVMLVALHTGMRLDEIASLTWSQIREEDGIRYFQVEDAKTPAGNRQVPIHSALSWLLTRTRGEPTARLWPQFNLEGPGKKAGADAGRDFSRFKSAKGFRDRSKAFHSFRKSVTRIMERAGVPQNEWATVFGHERGFTYGVYNPDGISIQRKAVLIELIDYPRVKLPAITAQEPPQRLRKRK
jgi:integrase